MARRSHLCSTFGTLALCVYVFVLCASVKGANSKAGPRKSFVSVTATVGMMTGVTHNDKAEFVELRCPVVTDPLTKISKDDPKCNVPILSIAKGRSAVAAFQKKYGVLSGDTVTATFDIQASSSGRRLLAGGADGSSPFKLRPESIRVVERGEQKEFYNGTVIELHSVVYLLDFCNWTHPFRSAEEFKRYLFSNVPNALPGNVQNAYRTCSFGKTTFHPDNVAVVGPITVDCKGQLARGVLPPVSFDGSSRCGVAEMQYWVQAAEAQAEKMAESDPKLRAVLQSGPRRRIITVLPRESRCAFAGLADFSCMGGGKCRIFVCNLEGRV